MFQKWLPVRGRLHDGEWSPMQEKDVRSLHSRTGKKSPAADQDRNQYM
jgi:hypothetical protein